MLQIPRGSGCWLIPSSVENRPLLYENIIIRSKSAEIVKEFFQLFAAGFVPTILPYGEKGGAAALYHHFPVAWVW